MQAQQNKIQVDLGKIPPQAIDVEEIVLGAILIEKNAYYQISDFFHNPDFFYLDAHKEIFTAILQLLDNSQPVDIATLTQQLQQNGKLNDVGGPFFVAKLTDKVSSSANLEVHARILMQKYALRRMIEIGYQTATLAYDETKDVFEVFDLASAKFLEIQDNTFKQKANSFVGALQNAIHRIEEIEKRKDQSSFIGVVSGYADLDKITGGFQEPALIILAARPGMGKTALALNFAINATKDQHQKNNVAIFSLEMNENQLVNRMISLESEVPLQNINRADLTPPEKVKIQKAVGMLEQKKIFIDDTAGLSVLELRNKCRALKLRHGINLIVIDYLQLMTTGLNDKGKSTTEQITYISKHLKGLAKELKVPIIALSQLSRAVEQRGGDKTPQLSDLRESGAIEQDADIVMFPYRHEYYDKETTTDEDGNSIEGLCQLIIAKNRDGATTRVNLQFVPHLTKFIPWVKPEDRYLESQPQALTPSQSFDPKKAAAKDDDGLPF